MLTVLALASSLWLAAAIAGDRDAPPQAVYYVAPVESFLDAFIDIA
jgi:hypothetical protein